jgi:hypothetical protein
LYGIEFVIKILNLILEEGEEPFRVFGLAVVLDQAHFDVIKFALGGALVSSLDDFELLRSWCLRCLEQSASRGSLDETR